MNTQGRHLSIDEIERYGGQKMSPAELLLADNHLDGCDACFERLGEQQKISDKLMAASKAFSITDDVEVSHLAYEELAALVDHQLDDIDREIAESHLEYCLRCETELKDLRGLVAQMQRTPTPELTHINKPSFRGKFMDFWQRPAFRIPALATLASVGIVVLAFLLLLPLRRENTELRAKIAELELHNDQLKEQATTIDNLQNEIATLREENIRLSGNDSAGDLAVIELKDGESRITLDGQGHLAGLQTTPAYEQVVKETLQSGRVKITTPLTGASGKSGTLMGDPTNPSFRLRVPVNIVIESDRPLFEWQGLNDMATFKVTIFDENLNKIAESEPVNQNQWKVTSALRRGQTYIWQVRASANNQELVAPSPGSPRVKFKVLEQAKLAEIENTKKTNGTSHLMMGILYADAGLLNDAEREFNALLRANPQSSVARRLLQSVKAAKR